MANRTTTRRREATDIAPKLGAAGLVYVLVSVVLNLAGVDVNNEFFGTEASWNQVISAVAAFVAGYLKPSNE